MFARTVRGRRALLLAVTLVAATAGALSLPAQEPAPPAPSAMSEPIESVMPEMPVSGGPVHEVKNTSERMHLTVNLSRILKLDRKILQAQVNNPDLLDLTLLEPNQLQVYAKKPGITQINIWDENKKIYAIDVVVYGDAERLTLLLRTLFPKAAIQVVPVATGAVLSGYVDQPEHVRSIIEIAQEFFPKVISNITVGGVQQVLLHVKVMEVSRTKMRSLGFDWAKVTGSNLVISGASSLLAGLSTTGGTTAPVTTGEPTFLFQVVEGSSAFFGVLEALREDNLMKVLAEPTLVTVSGRPAFFNVGGEFPILVPESLGTVAIEYKKFGTQVDFVPIVLGNGKIRLEVKPRVSEIDNTRSVTVQSINVPGLRVREVDTGVEMTAGQTLAIAGLVQNRVESRRRGIPWVMEVPYLGAMFRKVEEENNEIELLITVTPELVDALDAHEAPRCGPGMTTDSPNDWQLFMRGHHEVPKCCPACGGQGCPHCSGAAPSALHGPMQPIPQGDPPLAPPQAPSPPEAAAGRSPRGLPQLAAAAPGRQLPQKPYGRPASARPGKPPALQGFIGPVGYDADQ